jgi:hypothetical protein
MATSAFGKAFRAARNANDKEFEFGGKKYNTKLKEEMSEPAPVNTSRSMAAPVNTSRSMAAPVNTSRYVSPNDRMNMEAQDNANRGLDENNQPLSRTAKTVDQQNAAKAKSQKLPEPMPIADFLKQQGQGMKHGGSVKKMAEGGDSSGGRGMTQTPGDKKLNSPGRYATKILPSSMKPLTKTSSNDMSDDDNKTVSAKKGGYIKKMASGGSASSRGDGVAQRGKTRGKMC